MQFQRERKEKEKGCVSCVDDNFYGDSEDSSDESVKDVQLDESEEERAIGLDNGFDLPISEIGRLKNK